MDLWWCDGLNHQWSGIWFVLRYWCHSGVNLAILTNCSQLVSCRPSKRIHSLQCRAVQHLLLILDFPHRQLRPCPQQYSNRAQCRGSFPRNEAQSMQLWQQVFGETFTRALRHCLRVRDQPRSRFVYSQRWYRECGTLGHSTEVLPLLHCQWQLELPISNVRPLWTFILTGKNALAFLM